MWVATHQWMVRSVLRATTSTFNEIKENIIENVRVQHPW